MIISSFSSFFLRCLRKNVFVFPFIIFLFPVCLCFPNPPLLSRLIDIGHAGVQQSLPTPQNTHRNPGQTNQSRGALQHLLRGTNDVLVSTVTNSAPSSRRPSIDTTDDSKVSPDAHNKDSSADNPISTSENFQATLNTLESASASLSSTEVLNVPTEVSEAPSGPLAVPEDSTTEVESLDELDEAEQPTIIANGWKGAVTNLE